MSSTSKLHHWQIFSPIYNFASNILTQVKLSVDQLLWQENSRSLFKICSTWCRYPADVSVVFCFFWWGRLTKRYIGSCRCQYILAKTNLHTNSGLMVKTFQTHEKCNFKTARLVINHCAHINMNVLLAGAGYFLALAPISYLAWLTTKQNFA